MIYCADCDEYESKGGECEHCKRAMCADCCKEISVCSDCVSESDLSVRDTSK